LSADSREDAAVARDVLGVIDVDEVDDRVSAKTRKVSSAIPPASRNCFLRFVV
jgi:hypothetical protein